MAARTPTITDTETETETDFYLKKKEKLEKYNPILHANINTIETIGGGSVRCMLAEIV